VGRVVAAAHVLDDPLREEATPLLDGQLLLELVFELGLSTAQVDSGG
jgi:hypothetical protein